MEVDQVVFEYGKLHLNFVGCQRQNVLLAQQLANANKKIAELEAKVPKDAPAEPQAAQAVTEN